MRADHAARRFERTCVPGYGASQVLDGVSFSDRRRVGRASSAATAWARRRCARRSWAWCRRPRARSTLRRPAHRQPVAGEDRPGAASRTCRRVGGCSRRSPSTSTSRCWPRGTRGKRWTPDAVYELFPRLAERRRSGGGELSGGEQQMLAVGRALLLNGSLVMMDEPSEGLAPTIVDTLIEVGAPARRAKGSRCSSSNRTSAPRPSMAERVSW